MNRKERRIVKKQDRKQEPPRAVQKLFDEALLHHQAGRLPEAERLYRQILILKPDDLKTLNNLGGALRHLNRFDEAIVYLRRALALKPDYIDALNNMGSTLKGQLRCEEAIAYYRQALAFHPSYAAQIYSSILMSMVYAASISPQELAETAQEFGQRLADPLRRQRPLIRDK
jgi:tetratricopeptide (TPR) repeat protein